MHKESVIQEALKLSEKDRLDVAEALYQSLDLPVDPDADLAWSEEIARRVADIDQGRATLLSWEEARRQIVGNQDAPAD